MSYSPKSLIINSSYAPSGYYNIEHTVTISWVGKESEFSQDREFAKTIGDKICPTSFEFPSVLIGWSGGVPTEEDRKAVEEKFIKTFGKTPGKITFKKSKNK